MFPHSLLFLALLVSTLAQTAQNEPESCQEGYVSHQTQCLFQCPTGFSPYQSRQNPDKYSICQRIEQQINIDQYANLDIVKESAKYEKIYGVSQIPIRLLYHTNSIQFKIWFKLNRTTYIEEPIRILTLSSFSGLQSQLDQVNNFLDFELDSHINLQNGSPYWESNVDDRQLILKDSWQLMKIKISEAYTSIYINQEEYAKSAHPKDVMLIQLYDYFFMHIFDHEGIHFSKFLIEQEPLLKHMNNVLPYSLYAWQHSGYEFEDLNELNGKELKISDYFGLYESVTVYNFDEEVNNDPTYFSYNRLFFAYSTEQTLEFALNLQDSDKIVTFSTGPIITDEQYFQESCHYLTIEFGDGDPILSIYSYDARKNFELKIVTFNSLGEIEDSQRLSSFPTLAFDKYIGTIAFYKLEVSLIVNVIDKFFEFRYRDGSDIQIIFGGKSKNSYFSNIDSCPFFLQNLVITPNKEEPNIMFFQQEQEIKLFNDPVYLDLYQMTGKLLVLEEYLCKEAGEACEPYYINLVYGAGQKHLYQLEHVESCPRNFQFRHNFGCSFKGYFHQETLNESEEIPCLVGFQNHGQYCQMPCQGDHIPYYNSTQQEFICVSGEGYADLTASKQLKCKSSIQQNCSRNDFDISLNSQAKENKCQQYFNLMKTKMGLNDKPECELYQCQLTKYLDCINSNDTRPETQCQTFVKDRYDVYELDAPQNCEECQYDPNDEEDLLYKCAKCLNAYILQSEGYECQAGCTQPGQYLHKVGYSYECISREECLLIEKYYPNEDNGKCLPCPDGCLECSSEFVCLNCDKQTLLEFINGTSGIECQNFQDQAITELFRNKLINCNKFTEFGCLDCKPEFIFSQGECLPQNSCPKNLKAFKKESTTICVSYCPLNFPQIDENQCNKHDGCPHSSTYIDGKCIACPEGCWQCRSPFECTGCYGQYHFLMGLGMCSKECPDTYTVDQAICRKCPMGSQSCEVMGEMTISNFCQQTRNIHTIYEAKECFVLDIRPVEFLKRRQELKPFDFRLDDESDPSSIHPFYYSLKQSSHEPIKLIQDLYPINSFSINYANNCINLDQDSQKCKKCSEGYFLNHFGTCLKSCPTRFYSDQGTCKPCGTYCLDCRDKSTCLVCERDTYLLQSEAKCYSLFDPITSPSILPKRPAYPERRFVQINEQKAQQLQVIGLEIRKSCQEVKDFCIESKAGQYLFIICPSFYSLEPECKYPCTSYLCRRCSQNDPDICLECRLDIGGLWLDETGSCKCPDDFPYYDLQSEHCVDKCPLGSFLLEQSNECVRDCLESPRIGEDKVFRHNNTCLNQCPEGTYGVFDMYKLNGIYCEELESWGLYNKILKSMKSNLSTQETFEDITNFLNQLKKNEFREVLYLADILGILSFGIEQYNYDVLIDHYLDKILEVLEIRSFFCHLKDSDLWLSMISFLEEIVDQYIQNYPKFQQKFGQYHEDFRDQLANALTISLARCINHFALEEKIELLHDDSYNLGITQIYEIQSARDLKNNNAFQLNSDILLKAEQISNMTNATVYIFSSSLVSKLYSIEGELHSESLVIFQDNEGHEGFWNFSLRFEGSGQTASSSDICYGIDFEKHFDHKGYVEYHMTEEMECNIKDETLIFVAKGVDFVWKKEESISLLMILIIVGSVLVILSVLIYGLSRKLKQRRQKQYSLQEEVTVIEQEQNTLEKEHD